MMGLAVVAKRSLLEPGINGVPGEDALDVIEYVIRFAKLANRFASHGNELMVRDGQNDRIIVSLCGAT